ncbi:hypothetical protein ACFPH6_24385 [Streptomyces xiangluensis]|uniref:Lipoprotein n=1 Tax=Streptomyces xiangluensis TaxID=2665720 RepID=A0ABV8YQR4_9ACTN
MLLIALISVGACATTGERSDGASAAAVAFKDALRRGDAREACSLLAPRTRMELAESEKAPCGQAITKPHLPADGRVQETDVYGRQAMVTLTDDTVFLARFSSGWRVIAAGCLPRPGQPYQCQVKGE